METAFKTVSSIVLLYCLTAPLASAQGFVIVDPIDRVVTPVPRPEPVLNRPEYVRVRSVNYGGSGCPAGSVAINVTPDFSTFSMFWDSFIAEVGPGLPAFAKRKNCAVSIDLDFPQGWSYSVFSSSLRGYASLERGVDAVIQTSYYFQGSSATASLRTNLTGPYDSYFKVRDTLGATELVWSPCGMSRALTVNFSVSLNNMRNRSGSGLIAVDPIDGDMRRTIDLQWRRCR